MGRSAPARILFVVLLVTVGLASPALTSGAARSQAAAQIALPAGNAEEVLGALSCPSVTVCYVAGDQGSILSTRDGGTTWHTRRWVSPTYGMIQTLSCPAAGVCYALAAGKDCDTAAAPPLLRTSNSGGSWTEESHLLGCLEPALVCLRVSACATLLLQPRSPGKLASTTDGGKSWRIGGAMPRDFGFDTPGPLACSRMAVCYAGGYNAIARSIQGGKRWLISHLGARACTATACHEFTTIVCPTPRICYAGGSYYQGARYLAVAVATKDGFRTWRRRVIPGLGSVVGGAAPGGTHPIAPGIGALACPTTITCLVAGRSGRIARTTDGGNTWSLVPLSAPTPLLAMTCPGATVCYAAGRLHRLLRSSDGGMTWRDLDPAIFFSGTYSTRQQLHTYSRWFAATGPWQITAGVYPELPPCVGVTGVTLVVQNTAGKRATISVPGLMSGTGDFFTSVRMTGRLRLDVVSRRCTDFSVRIDGVR
jgi:hypothetical protein